MKYVNFYPKNTDDIDCCLTNTKRLSLKDLISVVNSLNDKRVNFHSLQENITNYYI